MCSADQGYLSHLVLFVPIISTETISSEQLEWEGREWKCSSSHNFAIHVASKREGGLGNKFSAYCLVTFSALRVREHEIKRFGWAVIIGALQAA